MLSNKDMSLLQLIEVAIRPNTLLDIVDPNAQRGIAAARLSGIAGDALDETPITHFGKRMSDALELLDSGIFPESLCDELKIRWASE